MECKRLGSLSLPRSAATRTSTRSARVVRNAMGSALLTVTIGLAGCTGKSSAAATPQPEPSATAAAVVAAPTTPAPASPASSNELQLGSAVPELPFTLQDGFKLELPSLKGKLIAVFFCSAHNDPECVREMQGLRVRYDELHEQNHVVVLGVSPQDAATHKAFIAQNKLPFDLSADGDRALAKAFGVPEGAYTPRTFLVGKDGTVRKVWRTADPDAQVREILALAHQ